MLKMEFVKMVQDKHKKKERRVKKIILFLMLVIAFILILILSRHKYTTKAEKSKIEPITTQKIVLQEEETTIEIIEPQTQTAVSSYYEIQEQEQMLFGGLEIVDYMARCVEAEAGNQDEIGKRLVADVILNRVDDNRFPDNIVDVINFRNAFEVVSNGRIDKIVASDTTFRIVLEELSNRYNTEVLYFRMGYYHNFGTRLFQHQDHYFSK